MKDTKESIMESKSMNLILIKSLRGQTNMELRSSYLQLVTSMMLRNHINYHFNLIISIALLEYIPAGPENLLNTCIKMLLKKKERKL